MNSANDIAFDSVAYSSGESIRQFSDSQTVNYGFIVKTPACDVQDVQSLNPLIDQVNFRAQELVTQEYGVTPESMVSDFGCVNYPFNGGDTTFQTRRTISLQKDTPSPKRPMTFNSGRGAKFSQDPGTSVTPYIKADQADNSTASQSEAAAVRTFTGQLGPDKTFAPAGIQGHHVGLGLIALAFLL